MKHTSVNFGKLNEISNGHLEQKIQDLQREKELLEREVRRMVALPFNQNNNSKNQFELQDKYTKLELVVQKMKDDLNKTRQLNGKYLAELQFKTKQVVVFKGDNEKMKKQLKQLLQKQTGNKSQSTEVDYDDYYRKLLGIVKLEGDDPVWRKYSNVASPNYSNMTENQLKKHAEQLWKSKL